MTIDELIKRLEAATGPDRELDAALWSLWDARPLEECGDGGAIYKRCPDDPIAFDVPPPYTASLDAAVALAGRVLPGKYWMARRLGERPCYGAIWDEEGDDGEALAATPALALTLAACRAIAGKEKT